MYQEIDLKELDKSVVAQTLTIAKNVRHLRKSTGMKQRDLALVAQLGDSKVSDIENGRAPNMELRTLIRLAMAFDIKASDLLRDWGN